MNLYKQLSDKHQKQVDDFLNKYAFFAFSDKQFRDGLQRLGITEEDAGKKLVRMSGTGGFMLRDHAQEYAALAESITDEVSAAVHDPGSGPRFAYDMFYYELANHEYGITGSVEDTLDALGYTFEEVQQDDVLKTALEQAAQGVMQNTV